VSAPDLLAGAFFALACAALLALPFVPAWREWRHPSDDGPLEVPEDGGQDPLFLAKRFRAEMARRRPAGPGVAYQPVDEVDLLDAEGEAEQDGRPILAVQPVRTVGAIGCLRPLYATSDLDLRGGAMFTQVMTEGRLDLGPRSRIAGWAHADKAARLGEHSVAVQRLSSSEALRLERGCCFERVHAPVVHFGRTHDARPGTAGELREGDLAALPGATARSPGLWRIEGDCELPDGHRFTGSLIVTGTLCIGAGTCVEGDVKAHKGILVGAAAEVNGSVICDNGIHVLGGAQIDGPLVSETHVLLAAGARIGREDAPTTVNAGAIIAQEGVIAHGTVWARQAGVVWGAAE
jgi:cytoskeletal protein CcmA (bactofilin family)